VKFNNKVFGNAKKNSRILKARFYEVK